MNYESGGFGGAVLGSIFVPNGYCFKWITNITNVSHLAKDEWETSDLIRFFIEMQNETE